MRLYSTEAYKLYSSTNLLLAQEIVEKVGEPEGAWAT